MELMQKYCKEDGVIGVEDLDRWPFSSNAVAFLSDTTSALSAKELKQVRETFYRTFMSNCCSIHSLGLRGGGKI